MSAVFTNEVATTQHNRIESTNRFDHHKSLSIMQIFKNANVKLHYCLCIASYCFAVSIAIL